MKNKIIKSIIFIGAVVLLITTLFLTVIGKEINDNTIPSPLFSIRSKNQINRYNNVNIQRNFLGKGENNFINVKMHNSRININELIIKISQLDKNNYNKYIQIIFSNLIEKNNIRNEDVEVLKGFFEYLKTKPKDALNLILKDRTIKSQEFLTHGCPSFSWCPTFEQTPLWCFIVLITFPIWLLYYCLTTLLWELNQNMCIYPQ